MKRTLILSVVLAAIGFAHATVHGAEAKAGDKAAATKKAAPTMKVAAAPVSTGKGSGWLSFGASYGETSGDADAFREAVTDYSANAVYGIRDAGYRWEDGGFLATFRGRAVHPDDYGADLKFSKKGLGSARFYIDQFPTYYDSTAGWYGARPMNYRFNKDLVLRRRKAGAEFVWAPENLPTLTLKLDHWERNGNVSMKAGGETDDTFHLYPMPNRTRQERETIGLMLEHTVGGFDVRMGIDGSAYSGRDTQQWQAYDGAGVFEAFENSTIDSDYCEITPYFELAGDLIEEQLRLAFEGRYRYVQTDSSYANADGHPDGSPWSGRDHSYWGNKHHGDLNVTILNTRLVYTPTQRLMAYFGIGLKYEDADHGSWELGRDPNTGANDVTTYYENDDNRRVWTGSLGVQSQFTNWLVGRLEGSWEHHDREKEWFAQRTFPAGSSSGHHWLMHGSYNRWEYGASLTAKPRRDLKFVARWRQRIYNNNTDDKIDTLNGSTMPDYYMPGFIDDTDRRINEASLLAQYRPSPYFYASYKLASKTTNTRVENEPSEEIGTWHTLAQNIGLTILPIDTVSVTAFGSLENTWMKNKIRHFDTGYYAGAFDGDYCRWGIEANWDVTKKLRVGAGFAQASAEGVYDYDTCEVFGEARYEINKTWSADARYMHITFDEGGDMNIDNYTGNVFSLGFTARF